MDKIRSYTSDISIDNLAQAPSADAIDNANHTGAIEIDAELMNIQFALQTQRRQIATKICTVCDGPIAEERINVLPGVQTCIHCARKEEVEKK